MSYSGMSKLLKTALVLFVISDLCVIIAFSTDAWLENEGVPLDRKFVNLGLWNVCLRDFKDLRHLYDRVFNGCRHILDEEYHFLDSFLRPPFFIAVQTFFTFCFTLMLVAIAGVLAYVLCFQHDMHNKIRLCRLIAWDLTAAGVCGTIAVIIFGALGDSRDWMPHFDHNYLSWSFGLAVVGTYGLIMTAVLFFVEAKVQKKKSEATQSQATFSMDHGKV